MFARASPAVFQKSLCRYWYSLPSCSRAPVNKVTDYAEADGAPLDPRCCLRQPAQLDLDMWDCQGCQRRRRSETSKRFQAPRLTRFIAVHFPSSFLWRRGFFFPLPFQIMILSFEFYFIYLLQSLYNQTCTKLNHSIGPRHPNFHAVRSQIHLAVILRPQSQSAALAVRDDDRSRDAVEMGSMEKLIYVTCVNNNTCLIHT